MAARFVFMTGGAFVPRVAEFLAAVDNPKLEKPFDLGAQLVDRPGLTPGQFDELLVGGWLAVHDGGFYTSGGIERHRQAVKGPVTKYGIIKPSFLSIACHCSTE